jgi:hypothetical protein
MDLKSTEGELLLRLRKIETTARDRQETLAEIIVLQIPARRQEKAIIQILKRLLHLPRRQKVNLEKNHSKVKPLKVLTPIKEAVVVKNPKK